MIRARTTATALLLAATAAGQEFASSTYAVPASTTRLALRDMDGDGRRDLLAVDVGGLALRRLSADGTLPAEDESTFAWPSTTTGWTLADLDGDGATEVLLLVDGRHVVAVRADAQGVLAAGAPLLENPQGFLPRGVRRVNFVRDVDADGRLDLVLPSIGRYLIHRNLGEGGFAPALAVAFRADIGTELGDPGRLDSRFSQDVQIPWFELRDVDGDGSTDLVSETVDEVLVHLAQPDLPVQPSWSMDLAALRAEMPARETFDLDNLLANVEPQIVWRTADLDGVAPDDVVLQTGGTFRVYLGGSTGPALERPSQVLRASGNVIYFLLRDVNGDGRPDLQLLRAATISFGDVVRMLVMPGALDFDVFTYLDVQGSAESERGEIFARRPSARTGVSLHIPALLGFLDELEEMEADYKMRRAVPAAALTLDGDGALNDVADLSNGELALWRDRVPAGFQGSLRERLATFDVDELLEEYVISELDHMGDGGRLDIGLEDIRKMMVTPGWDLRQAVKDEQPVARIPLAVSVERARMRIEDLDGDGRSDIVITGDTDEDGHRVVEFLVRK